ncbi:SPOR domain-containing protein [Pseudomonas stutzeri]|nr:SPOR domain-containing protein [Stutzerimonas stutzeri]
MAARKQKAKPRGASRTPAAPARKPVPGWAWLVSGAAIGGFLVFLALLEPGRDEVKRAPAAKPESAASRPATPPPAPRPKYEFYEELTKATPTPLPGGQPTPEQIEAVEAARAQALLEGRTPPPRLVAPATPPTAAAPPAAPTTGAATPRPAPVPAPAATTAQTPPPASPAPQPAAQPTARYYLQVGSFANHDQAESARVRLLLLGQDARIESGQVGGKTWHRVVVGPFASRSQADGAKQQLGANGVGSVVQQRR